MNVTNETQNNKTGKTDHQTEECTIAIPDEKEIARFMEQFASETGFCFEKEEEHGLVKFEDPVHHLWHLCGYLFFPMPDGERVELEIKARDASYNNPLKRMLGGGFSANHIDREYKLKSARETVVYSDKDREFRITRKGEPTVTFSALDTGLVKKYSSNIRYLKDSREIAKETYPLLLNALEAPFSTAWRNAENPIDFSQEIALLRKNTPKIKKAHSKLRKVAAMNEPDEKSEFMVDRKFNKWEITLIIFIFSTLVAILFSPVKSFIFGIFVALLSVESGMFLIFSVSKRLKKNSEKIIYSTVGFLFLYMSFVIVVYTLIRT